MSILNGLFYHSTDPNNSPSIRFTKIDDLYLENHTYLTEQDECYFFVEYFPRQGFNYSNGNDLIINLKKPVDRKNKPEYRFKIQAIERCSEMLAQALSKKIIEKATWIPVPPSKSKNDPLYDDRILQILQTLEKKIKSSMDIRELFYIESSRAAMHLMESRLTPDELKKTLKIRNNLLHPQPKIIIILDDVITSGTHFRAIKDILLQYYSDIPIIGIFIARRVPI